MLKFLKGVTHRTELINLLIFAAMEIQIPEDELLDLDFFWLKTVLEIHADQQKYDDVRLASLQALLANINRDAKRKPQPYKITDFLPQKPKTDAEIEKEILRIFGVTKTN